MSILHVKKGSTVNKYNINDGKSNSLHRYVDLNKLEIFSIMGKQIGGKPISTSGTLGMQLLQLSQSLMMSEGT